MANGLGPFFASRARPGIFGRRQDVEVPDEERQAQKKASFFDRFAQVFSGPSDPRLSPEQNTELRDQALMQAGIAIMAAGGRTGLDRASLLTALAEGAQTGQAAGAQARRRAVIGGLAQQPNALPQFRAMFLEAIQAGDDESARSIATVINAMEAAEAKQAGGGDPYIYRTLGDEIVVIDKRSGEEVTRIKGKPGSGSRLSGSPVRVVTPDGRNVTAIFDRGILGFREVGTGRPLPGAQLPDDSAVDPYVEALAPIAGPDFVAQVQTLEEIAPPAIWKHWLEQSDMFRWLAPEDAQVFNAAGDNAISILVMVRSGRQASDRERRMLRQALIPRPGDKPRAVRLKLESLKRQGAALVNASNRGEDIVNRPDLLLPKIRSDLDQRLDDEVDADGNSRTPIYDRYRNRERR